MIGRARAYRARVQRRRRRMAILAAGALLAAGLGTAFSLASFAGGDLAEAAVTRAKSLIDLMDQRSPGVRTAAELTKIKRKHKALAQRELPEVPKNLAEVIAPPTKALAPVTIATTPGELQLPSPPGEVLLPPPGGAVPPSGCCGGHTPPPHNPPLPPPPPPALPEPGTWMTMIVGFGLTGWSIRRSKIAVPARAQI